MPDQSPHPKSPHPESPRRLKRSSSDRLVSGVCGGLGSYFSVDPLILRIAFAVSIFFGGLGIVLYLAMALLVPVDDAPDGKPVIAMSRSEGLAIVVAVAVLVIAIPLFGALFAWIGDPGVLWVIALVVLAVAALTAWRDRGRRGKSSSPAGDGDADGAEKAQPPAGSEPTTEIMPLAARSSSDVPAASTTSIGEDTPIPTDDPVEPSRRRSGFWTVLLVCGTALFSLAAFMAAALTVGFGLGALVAATIAAGGLAIVALAFGAGSAARWLIAPLAAMVLGAGAAEAADLDLKGGVGEERYRPVHAMAIPEGGYRLGAGELSIDLRDVPWRDGETVPLRADAGVGYIEIIVPPEVCVVGSATARAGYVALGGYEDDGLDAEARQDLRPEAGSASASRPESNRERGAARSARSGGDSTAPVVEIDASVDFGAIHVINDGSRLDAERSDRHGPLPTDALSWMQRLNERVCAG